MIEDRGREAPEGGRCRVCVGIVAAARAAGGRAGGRSQGSPEGRVAAGRLWKAAMEGDVRLVRSREARLGESARGR